MFISDRFVFLELHKTGCTHIRRLLSALVGGRAVGKHNQADASLFTEGRVFLGSVRDPWTWYCSLWAYGCDRKGTIHANTTQAPWSLRGLGFREDPLTAMLGAALRLSRPRDPEKWRAAYRDVNDPEGFRSWMRLLHDPNYFYAVGDGYGAFQANKDCGLLTHRYLKLFCTKAHENDRLNALRSGDQIAEYEAATCFIDHFIRNESLEDDLLRALEKSGASVSAEAAMEIRARPKTNPSSRSKGPEFYFDAGTEQLVADRDKLLVQKFGYRPPSRRSTQQEAIA